MKNSRIKSEKITSELRNKIYSKFYSSIRKDSHEVEELIQKSFKEAYMNEFFTKKEQELLKKIPELSYTTYLRYSYTDFGISEGSIPEMDKLRGNIVKYDISFGYLPTPPKYDIDEENSHIKILNRVLDNQRIREGMIGLIRKNFEIIIYNETCCDKYLPNNINNYWRISDVFCSDCTTTFQLMMKYPEVYDVYKKVRKHLIQKDELIEKLRQRLGFINFNNKN